MTQVRQQCPGCGCPVQTNPFLAAGGQIWHWGCFCKEYKQDPYDEALIEDQQAYAAGIYCVPGKIPFETQIPKEAFNGRNTDK